MQKYAILKQKIRKGVKSMVISDLEITQASIELMGGLITAMLAVIIIINGHKEPSIKMIQKMLFTASIDFVAEALAYIFRGNVDLFSLIMTRACNAAVFFLNFLLALLTIQYIYSLLEAKGISPPKTYWNIIVGCFLAATAMLLLNLVTGWMYYFDEQNYYHRSMGWYFYTLLSLVCLVIACILVFRYRRSFSRPTLFSLLLFEFFPIIAIVVQSLYYGISITNIGIGISIVLVLVTYLIDWNRSDEVEDRTLSQVRRSYETIVLFSIMVISISASIISCIVSIRRISADISVSSSQVVAHIVGDRVDNLFLRPMTVTETVSKDAVFRNYMRRSEADPQEVEADMAAYLESIRTGFDYQMVYAVCDASKTYYTYNGIAKTVDPEHDPADLWYQHFLDSGVHCKLEVDTDEVNNWDLSVFVNTEVCDADGQFLGVCGIGLEMQELQNQLAAFERQYGLKITVADPSGAIQIDTDTARIERDSIQLPSPELISSGEFVYEELDGSSRLIGYMESLDWYLIIEDLNPNKVDILQILLPNIFIFMVGLFMLAVAFIVIMIRERKISAELIEKRKTSLSDELTRLKNRRAFDQDCAQIAEENSAAEKIAIMIDLNGLKEINDRQGHQAGDELITATAEAMRQSLGEYGTLYRIGGDEYFALLSCTKEQMEDAMALFEHRTANWNGKLIHGISTANGIAVGADHPEMTITELVDLADRLMYEDKNAYYIRTGKDRRRHRS